MSSPEGRTNALAFVDLETTGGNSVEDRITEIGIVSFDDGEIVDEWSSLVDPGIAIPPMIQSLTGITQAMVRGAPPFSAMAGEVRRRLAGRVFVAHNARFDYGFLKSEFRRIDERFSADVLCTVRLSRHLFSQHHRHGLDAIVERYGLDPTDRHRALGDARLIARFYRDIVLAEPSEHLDAALRAILRRTVIPAHLPESQVDAVPEAPGVYVFRGICGTPLYVGKAVNLRERVFSHFHSDTRLAGDARLAAEARSLEFFPTPGEFSALVKEIDLIRSLAPLYNIALRKRETSGFLQVTETPGREGAALRFVASADVVLPRHEVTVPGGDLDEVRPDQDWPVAAKPDGRASNDGALYGPFSSRQSARAALSTLGREHRLCDRAIGLWTGERACFSRQIGRCLGLCCGEETHDAHRARLLQALAPHRLARWPFAGPVQFAETDSSGTLVTHLYFDRWCRYDPVSGTTETFDVDIQKLLRRMLKRAPDAFTPLADAIAAPQAPRSLAACE